MHLNGRSVPRKVPSLPYCIQCASTIEDKLHTFLFNIVHSRLVNIYYVPKGLIARTLSTKTYCKLQYLIPYTCGLIQNLVIYPL